MKEPVAGSLRITSTDHVSGAKTVITGVVTGPGVEPTPVQHTVEVPIKKMAAVFRRYDVPVVFDRTDPSRLRFIWDEVPDEKQLDLLEASRVADRMRAGGDDAGQQPGAAFPDINGLLGNLGNLTNGRNVRVYTTTNMSTSTSGADLPPQVADLIREAAEQFGQVFGAPNPPESEPRPTDSMPWDEPPRT